LHRSRTWLHSPSSFRFQQYYHRTRSDARSGCAPSRRGGDLHCATVLLLFPCHTGPHCIAPIFPRGPPHANRLRDRYFTVCYCAQQGKQSRQCRRTLHRWSRPLDDARFTSFAPLSRRYRLLRSTSLPYVRCDRLRPDREAAAFQLLLSMSMSCLVLSRSILHWTSILLNLPICIIYSDPMLPHEA